MNQSIRFCQTADGVRIAYAVSGNGPPVVKVANWLSHLEYDWQSPVWRHWFSELTRYCTLIRYDQRGCGLSDRETEDFSFAAWIRDLEAVVDAAGLSRFALLGISQGGPIAVAYCVRYPERVVKLLMHGTYARGREKRDGSSRQKEESRVLIDLIRLGWGRSNAAFRQVFATLYMPDATLEQMRWFDDLQQKSTSAENAARIVSGFDSIDVTSLARRISVPTLIFHSRHDARIPFEEGRIMASLIPKAHFIPLESNNHILLASEPAWREFSHQARRFLSVRDSMITFSGIPAELTKREAEVLDLIARGHRNDEIARRLSISPKTVRNHITNIFGKLQVSDRSQAIVMAREAGWGKTHSSS